MKRNGETNRAGAQASGAAIAVRIEKVMSKFVSAATLTLALAALAQPATAQRQEISNDMSKCRSGAGPAILVTVDGFKDRGGNIRVQSYEATKAKWLEKGQWINRIDIPVAKQGGAMKFCVPLPKAGNYGIAVRHDRDGNGKSGWNDGGGFSNNPDISLFNLEPSVGKVSVSAGAGVTPITIILNYRQGTAIEPIG